VVGRFLRLLHDLVSTNPTCSKVLLCSVLWIFMLHGFEQSLAAALVKLLQESLIAASICVFLTFALGKRLLLEGTSS